MKLNRQGETYSVTKAGQVRALKPLDDEHAHSPFPHDPNALGSLRADQVPRFFGALTDQDGLEDKTVRLNTLTAMQNRVHAGKVEAMRGDQKPDKPPVVVRMNGRNYIADGHHRLTAQWLDNQNNVQVKFKDLSGKDNAVKSADTVEAQILKVNDEQRIVYGWASVITDKGSPVIDTQGDIIEPHELEKAATEFMSDARMAMVMHERNDDNGIDEDMRKGDVVHSFPLTADIAKSLGINCDREGWIVGVKVHDDDVWKAVKSGALRAFSIGARAVREEV